MVGIDSNFAADAQAGKRFIIVAGHNFGGGGKSIEHPIYPIKGPGVKAVIVESCLRYFFRNAINNELLMLTPKGITSNVSTGDDLEIDLSKGEIKNITNGVLLKSTLLPDIALKLLEKGGYIPYVKETLAKSTTRTL